MSIGNPATAGPPAGGGPDETAAYALGQPRPNRQRLLAQAEQLSPLTNQLLDQVGLTQRHRAIDIACGPLGILHPLCQRVGDAGHVMGLDVDPVMIECARQVPIERRLHIELALGDASSTGLPRSSFDLVHARLVLGNILAREQVVTEMAALARPGGAVALPEIDIDYFVRNPPNLAWESLRDLLVGAHRITGRDMAIGRRLERVLHQAGLVDVHSAPHVIKTVPGDPWHTNLPHLAESARALLDDANQAGGAALDRLLAEAHDYIEEPGSTTAIAFWQAWGVKPNSHHAGGEAQ